MTIDPVFALISVLFLTYGIGRLFQENRRINRLTAKEPRPVVVPHPRLPDSDTTTRIETKQCD